MGCYIQRKAVELVLAVNKSHKIIKTKMFVCEMCLFKTISPLIPIANYP